MKAAVVLPAPGGLNQDLIDQAIYEFGKLGTIESSSLLGEGAIEVYELPQEWAPPGAPPGLDFLRFTASLIPYAQPKDHTGYSL